MEFVEKVGLRRGISHFLSYSCRHMFKSGPLVLAFIFCVSGVLQPTTVEFLTLNGAFDKSTLLIVLPNYIGMSFAVSTRFEVVYTSMKHIVWLDMVALAAIDIISQGCCLIGLVYAGSSIFIIIYSSTTIWAAVWSFLLLQKQLNWKQWLGIVIVVSGLSLTAYDSNHIASSLESHDQMLGIILVLVGSFTHALTWVLIEKWTNPRMDSIVSIERPAPELVCTIMGILGSTVCVLWQVFYTIPHWHDLIVQPIHKAQGSTGRVMFAFIFLSLMGFLHAVSFYHLLGHVGSVATGVMKGVQSVAVLLLSHVAFCSIQSSQCFTTCKGVALVVVLFGVYFYMAFTGLRHEKREYQPIPAVTASVDNL